METAPFQVSVVAADQRLPSQLVNVESEWTTIDLKKHLSKIYPGEPPVDSQKLIFAGQLLLDESKLRSVIKKEAISSTVHLVLSPNSANQAKAAMQAKQHDLSDLTSEAMDNLHLRYLKYLQEYNQEQPPLPEHLEPILDDDEELRVEIEVQENQEQIQPNFLQRMLGFRGFQLADENNQNDGAGGEPIDIFDIAYAIFRLSFMVTICVSYASWQRIFLVVAVAFFFYWRNGGGDRRVPPRPMPQAAPAEAPQAPPTDQQQPSTSDATGSQTDSASHAPTSDSQAPLHVDGHAQPTPASQHANEVQLIGPPSRMEKLADMLRQVGETSFRLVCTIFTSLVPEVPPHIE